MPRKLVALRLTHEALLALERVRSALQAKHPGRVSQADAVAFALARAAQELAPEPPKTAPEPPRSEPPITRAVAESKPVEVLVERLPPPDLRQLYAWHQPHDSPASPPAVDVSGDKIRSDAAAAVNAAIATLPKVKPPPVRVTKAEAEKLAEMMPSKRKKLLRKPSRE